MAAEGAWQTWVFLREELFIKTYLAVWVRGVAVNTSTKSDLWVVHTFYDSGEPQ